MPSVNFDELVITIKRQAEFVSIEIETSSLECLRKVCHVQAVEQKSTDLNYSYLSKKQLK